MPDYSRYQTLQIACADQVATVTLHRPEALNAVNEQMHSELETLFAEIAYDDAINAIVLTGAGRAFSAGAAMGGGEAAETVWPYGLPEGTLEK